MSGPLPDGYYPAECARCGWSNSMRYAYRVDAEVFGPEARNNAGWVTDWDDPEAGLNGDGSCHNCGGVMVGQPVKVGQVRLDERNRPMRVVAQEGKRWRLQTGDPVSGITWFSLRDAEVRLMVLLGEGW